ncbi:MAG TPA: hypothetical protein PKA16_02280 [Ottowia sp.]|uniref:hypothetical protein n=1 Tax=Ottowia sp. TaxID=1898956 RepID=UPI002C56A8F6|nr:hypothetical protein [Ottowia sp.]HMN20199.1 hypothetical protein [Ottowia sp.]
MTTALKYVHQQLASTGFVIIDIEAAITLRPDLFNTGMEAGFLLGEAKARNQFADGNLKVSTYCAELEELGRTVTVLARSRQRLEERITELTGYTVLGLQAERPDDTRPSQAEVAAQAQLERERHRQAKEAGELAKLRATAAKEPPAHDCPLRREILRARQEVSRREESELRRPSP